MNLDTLKRWWHSHWSGSTLVALGAVIEYLNTVTDLLTPYLGKWSGVVVLGLGVLRVLLRLRTRLPEPPAGP